MLIVVDFGSERCLSEINNVEYIFNTLNSGVGGAFYISTPPHLNFFPWSAFLKSRIIFRMSVSFQTHGGDADRTG